VGALPKRPLPRSSQHGQHFLDRRTAAELTRIAGISAGDVGVEIGAGWGVLTRLLMGKAGLVLAIENDPLLLARLIKRFSDDDNVFVVGGDALSFPLPADEFRVFGNIPFGITTSLLRRLMDPHTALSRADLVVQYGVAKKRTRSLPSTMLGIGWGPWWEFDLAKRIPASNFTPRPKVDAALLSIVRRREPLLPLGERESFLAMLTDGFSVTGPLKSTLATRLGGRSWNSLAERLGIARDAHASHLTLNRWIALYRDSRERPSGGD
jgi:23S rRNA (adenine-N6)-dimethyltransferase